MAQEQQAINVSHIPALRELVEEVARTRQPKRLRVDESHAEVVLTPVKPRGGRTDLTPAEREELLRTTFGSWKGLVDPDRLKQELSELQRDETSPRSL
jgi:hypothetical protein